jgi:hypothetical protein
MAECVVTSEGLTACQPRSTMLLLKNFWGLCSLRRMRMVIILEVAVIESPTAFVPGRGQ